MSLDWYKKHWLDRETPQFVTWWLKDYGLSTNYENTTDEQDEYWVRRAFALKGWLARGDAHE